MTDYKETAKHNFLFRICPGETCCNPHLYFLPYSLFSCVSVRTGTNVEIHHNTEVCLNRHAKGLFMVSLCPACGLCCLSHGGQSVVCALSHFCLKKACCGYGQKPCVEERWTNPIKEQLRTEALLSPSTGAKTQRFTLFPFSGHTNVFIFCLLKMFCSLCSLFSPEVYLGPKGQVSLQLLITAGYTLHPVFPLRKKMIPRRDVVEKRQGRRISTRQI